MTKKEVLAFLVDPGYPWPAELREDYRLVKERNKPKILEEVNRNEEKLAQFKQELSGNFRGTACGGERGLKTGMSSLTACLRNLNNTT